MLTPWLYFYTENVFDKVLQDTVDGFDLKPFQYNGVTLKEKSEFITSLLKTTSSEYIIVSDSDIIVKPGLVAYLSKYQKDMTFIAGECKTSFMRLRVCSDVIQFWSSFTTFDIEKFNGSHEFFSDKIVNSDNWDKTSSFYVLQIIPTGLGVELDFAEKIFHMAQHIDFQKYMQYVPQEINPYIYKIQELNFLSYEEMRNTK